MARPKKSRVRSGWGLRQFNVYFDVSGWLAP